MKNGGDPEGRLRIVAALVQQLPVAACGCPAGVNTCPDGQGRAVGWCQAARSGKDADRFIGMGLGLVQVPAEHGIFGQIGQGIGDLAKVIAVAEYSDSRGQVLPGCHRVADGQGEAAQYPVAPSSIRIPCLPLAFYSEALHETLRNARTPSAGQIVSQKGTDEWVRPILSTGRAQQVCIGESLLGLRNVTSHVRYPPEVPL